MKISVWIEIHGSSKVTSLSSNRFNHYPINTIAYKGNFVVGIYYGLSPHISFVFYNYLIFIEYMHNHYRCNGIIHQTLYNTRCPQRILSYWGETFSFGRG